MKNFKISHAFRSPNVEYPGYTLFKAEIDGQGLSDIFILANEDLKVGDVVPGNRLNIAPGITYFARQAYVLADDAKPQI